MMRMMRMMRMMMMMILIIFEHVSLNQMFLFEKLRFMVVIQ